MAKRAHLSGVVPFAMLVAAVAAALAGEGSAGAQELPPAAGASQLERELGPGVEVALHRETGAVSFVGTAPGRPIPRRPGLGADASPATAARAFLAAYGREFGLRAGARELRVVDVAVGRDGNAAVRLQQQIDGVPVLAGELAVSVDSEGNVLSALGEVEPDDVDTSAEVGAAEARRIAIAVVARGRAQGAAVLRSTEPRLSVYDSRLLGGPGLDVPLLVWGIEVSSSRDPTLRQLVLVDADIGVVAQAIDLIETAKDRRICDAENKDSRYPCEAPYDREEEDGPTGNADIDSAYDFAGDTYDFFFGRFGRDSLDDAGMPLISTVRYCPEGESCPYQNAFWDGEQMVYGEGFAAADDVVAHELGHGFTQFTSNLFYWYQSGAINESMSDVFGEFVDLTNEAGDDSGSVRWLLGEDIPEIGAIRNMQDPPEKGDPDKMTSSLYVADEDQRDNGGVHSNSGVNNKAAYLIADGDTFNDTEVTGIGIDKAARVYFEAEVGLLTSGSDYADLYNALQQACVNSIGGDEGITADDCEEVTDAVTATEMNVQPPAAPAPEAPVCGEGENPADLFFDDLEDPASGNWTHSALSGEDGWHYPQNPNLFSWFDATYATSGETNFWGYNVATTSDYAIAQTSDLTIPAGPVYLRFDHSYAFEDSSKPLRRYDGGQLEYSVDGGSTWLDAESLFTHNGYNGTIESKYGNPLAGEAAFTAESNGYISSRVDLSSLSGEEVRFRFRIGTDEIVDDYGWFVDDVHVYECEEAAPELPLTLNINGGEGTVVSDPAGIECTAPGCTEETADFEEGAEVTLTASPAAGYRFWFWEGCPSVEGRQCTVTMSEAETVGAQFLRQYDLTITKTADSVEGFVLAYPPGIATNYVGKSATYSYPEGKAVTLDSYEYPGNHRHFVEFTNGTGGAEVCNGLTECSYPVEEDGSIEALFEFDPKVALSLEKAGGGTAFIKSINGIYCDTYCGQSSAEYYEGEEITVTWTLRPGTSSIDWGAGSGTCTGKSELAEGTCEVTMSGAKALTATLE